MEKYSPVTSRQEPLRRAVRLPGKAAHPHIAGQRVEDARLRFVVLEVRMRQRQERVRLRTAGGGTDATTTSSEGAATGIGFNSRVLITVNTAVFAPIPNPSVTTTKRTNTGLLRIARPDTKVPLKIVHPGARYAVAGGTGSWRGIR